MERNQIDKMRAASHMLRYSAGEIVRGLLDEIEQLQTDVKRLNDAPSNIYTRIHAERDVIQRERDRLLVLATKHCPKNHHDWQEILRIAGDA